MEFLKCTQFQKNDKKKNGNKEQIEQNYSDSRFNVTTSTIASNINNLKSQLKVRNCWQKEQRRPKYMPSVRNPLILSIGHRSGKCKRFGK